MSRETNYQGIILKKQPYAEADEIITFYTEEAGKVRGLAKSVKLVNSKLQSSLQQLFIVDVTLTRTSSLAKVIRAQPLEVLGSLREQYDLVSLAFVATELVMKATPDEQKNEFLYESLLAFLKMLNLPGITLLPAQAGLIKFKIDLAAASGMDVHRPSASESLAGQGIKFSASGGGFYIGSDTSDSQQVAKSVFDSFLKLQEISYAALSGWTTDISELQELLSSFLTYQLEREIKSERFL